MNDQSKVHPIETSDDLISCPKAKRSRGQLEVSEVAPWKSAIAALSTCVSRQDCINSLSRSFEIFNHSNEQIHDEEISAKADASLCRLLSLLLHKESFEGEMHAQETSSDPREAHDMQLPNEIACTCQITEMIYRCSREVMETSFRDVGMDFIHLFSTILGRQLPILGAPYGHKTLSPSTQLASSKQIELCLRSITKVLCHYARSKSATVAMAKHPQLLSQMTSILNHPIGIVPFDVQNNTLWVLANMAYCSENIQHMLAEQGELLDALLQVVTTMQGVDHGVPHQQALRLQHSAFRCLLNLSWDQKNKVVMSERDDLLHAIMKMVALKAPPGSVGETRGTTMLIQTRLLALGCLRNLANTPSSQQHHMCTFRNGLLLDFLCDTTQGDEEISVRDKSFAVIFNLISVDTAELLISHQRLVNSLVDSASVPTDVADSASTLAFRSLHSLEQALVSGSAGPEDDSIAVVRRAIEQVNIARRFHNITIPVDNAQM